MYLDGGIQNSCSTGFGNFLYIGCKTVYENRKIAAEQVFTEKPINHAIHPQPV
jgi:hypothetical protein